MTQEALAARVRYLDPVWRDRAERPRVATRETRHANTRFYDVGIESARPLHERGELDLDTTGFVLVQHATSVTRFDDPDQVRDVYYPEVRKLMQEQVKAAEVRVLQHVIRTENPTGFNDAYARYMHCDYSRAPGERNAWSLRGEGASGPPGAGHHVLYNVWQPIEREVQRNPLTLIDARSLDRDDLIDYFFLPEGDAAVASMPVYRSDHRLFYFPHMQTDEALVFKQRDLRPGKAFACPHTSFDAPAPPEALARRSIETRVLCVFA